MQYFQPVILPSPRQVAQYLLTTFLKNLFYLMKKLFFSLMLPALLGGSSLPGLGQAPAWQNALDTPGVLTNGGTGSGSYVSATAADASGNVYVAGLFFGRLTLGNLALPSSSTGFPLDGFVAKWVPANNSFAWVTRIATRSLASIFQPETSGFKQQYG